MIGCFIEYTFCLQHSTSALLIPVKTTERASTGLVSTRVCARLDTRDYNVKSVCMSSTSFFC